MQVVERGGADLPSWMTSVTSLDRCDDEDHVTRSGDAEPEGLQCGVPELWLEGVAGPQQVGLRYELVVHSAVRSNDRRCVLETADDDLRDSFFVQVLPGQRRIRLLPFYVCSLLFSSLDEIVFYLRISCLFVELHRKTYFNEILQERVCQGSIMQTVT